MTEPKKAPSLAFYALSQSQRSWALSSISLAPVLIAAFNDAPQVVAYGTQQARTVTLFYFLLAFSHCAAGIMRGAGKATVPMFVMMVCWCIIRVTYITIVVKVIPSISVIFWAYPLTWCLSSIVFLLFLLKSNWLRTKA